VIRFHAVYWIAMLLSAKLVLPEKIFVHGYLTSAGQKMSKSLGNIIDPFELVKKYGTDSVRYFLLREIPSTEDGDFTYEKFEKRYNSDLAAGLGNLVARVITLAARSNSKFQMGPSRRLGGWREGWSPNSKQIPNLKFQTIINKTWKNWKNALDNFKFNEALVSIWDLISFCDGYIEKERPWEKSNKQLSIINDLLSVLANISQFLQPFLPETSEKILKQIKTKKPEILFPRK